MKRTIITSILAGCAAWGNAQETQDRTPFSDCDLTWINGQNRQKESLLVLKDPKGEVLLTGVVMADGYFNYDLNNPIDNTHTISSTIGRSNEFTLNFATIGIETGYKNIIGRLWLQYGQMASIIQDADATVAHGRNTSISNLRNVREAAAGYHFNTWYGINAEMGIFMSYIGLESYVTQENWCYQRSMVCDFTPFYFSGARLQAYPTKHFKTELWLLNGWQSYNSWTRQIGLGNSNYYRPNSSLQLVANFYYGKDNRDGTVRFHHDNSIVKRFYNRPEANGISKAAFSLNTHYGFQAGDNVSASRNFMTGAALSQRVWFHRDKLAVTARVDFVRNPGLYLAFTPSPVTPNDFTDAVLQDPDLTIGQGTLTFDVMPNDYMTLRLEARYRKSDKPYFAGSGGTTSPDGWNTTEVGAWRPDLVKEEGSVTVAVNFRL